MKKLIFVVGFAAVALATVAAVKPVKVSEPALINYDDPGAPPPGCPPFCGEKK